MKATVRLQWAGVVLVFREAVPRVSVAVGTGQQGAAQQRRRKFRWMVGKKKERNQVFLFGHFQWCRNKGAILRLGLGQLLLLPISSGLPGWLRAHCSAFRHIQVSAPLSHVLLLLQWTSVLCFLILTGVKNESCFRAEIVMPCLKSFCSGSRCI